jgi:diguanylate cyclase (GGDEF)-like protein
VIEPQKPDNEVERLSALRELNVLDTPINSAFERVTRLTKKMFEVPMVAISLVDGDRQWFKSEQGLNVCETNRNISFCGHAILQDQIFLIPDALKDERFHDNPLVTGGPKIRFYAGYPIRSPDGYKIGSFCIMDTNPRDISIEDLDPLKDMAALVEQQLSSHAQKKYQSKIMQELDQAKREKMIDSLTRVWNREGIEINFREQTDVAKKNKEYLALTIIDIDDFKHINDTYGHNAGDQVLREITKRILTSLKEQDILGRWGGEEFLGIIALKCENPDRCLEVFENVRQNISCEPVEFESKEIPVTASFGITYTKNLDEELTQIVAKAAKRSGKNKCVVQS